MSMRNTSSRSLHRLFASLAMTFSVGVALPAYATPVSLQSLLQHAFQQDPRLLEAQANIEQAQAQTNISRAGHYPTVSVGHTQYLYQQYKNPADAQTSSPSLQAQVNLFAWGGIQAAVDRDHAKTQYFTYKKDETRDQLGKTIALLYLNALRAKENIAIYQESIQRHRRTLGNIRHIAKNDHGRSYEVHEAQSRLLQAQATLSQQERTLRLTLSQLSRYSAQPLQANDLIDPFTHQDTSVFLNLYRSVDLKHNPTYVAQQHELESTRASTKAAQARRLPAVNLEGRWNNKGHHVAVNLSWQLLDFASSHAVQQNRAAELIAQAKLNEVALELEEQTRSAEIDMRQNQQLINISQQQVLAQRKVTNTVENQFKVGRHSLLDVLNAYRELSDVQIVRNNARHDYREAAVHYLTAQSSIANWASAQPAHSQP